MGLIYLEEWKNIGARVDFFNYCYLIVLSLMDLNSMVEHLGYSQFVVYYHILLSKSLYIELVVLITDDEVQGMVSKVLKSRENELYIDNLHETNNVS